jgi:7-cyano-7-deazaguanine synthase
MKRKTQKAVILLSGGVDSSTTLAIAQQEDYETYALSFLYGQRHDKEILAAQNVAKYFAVKKHIVLDIDLRSFGGSALTDDIPVPKERGLAEISGDIPVTYVPARNTIFLSFALAWAEVLEAYDIFIGVNALDYSGYPDCRLEYIEAFERMANLATKAGVEGKSFKIHTPLIKMTKGEIIRQGLALSVDFSKTTTCYDPSSSGAACGACDACILRLKGFQENGIADPIVYQGNVKG